MNIDKKLGRKRTVKDGENHTFFLPAKIWASIDKKKTKISRTTFICEAIEEKLKNYIPPTDKNQ